MVVNKYNKRSLFEGFSIFILLGILAVTIFTAINTGVPLFLVIVGFSPSIITIILGIILFEESMKGKLLLWATPFLVLAIFFYVVTSQNILASNLDVNSLIGLNILLSVIYVAASLVIARLLLLDSSKKKKMFVPTKVSSIKDFIASIEDKSKALNFVIGRVYNKFHGGSKELRDKIMINKEWYNEFSSILKNEYETTEKLEDIKDGDKLVSLLYVVNKIEERLNLLKKSESELLGSKHNNLKNLERDITGKDSVLDVLKRNDKDPVESYYEGALGFCDVLKKKLNVLLKKN